MKLSKTSKKVIAIVCSLAMVVAGLTFTPSNSTKADDYSNLIFKVSDNNPDLAIAFVTQGGVTTEQEINYCLDQGTNFYCATTAAFTKPDFKTVTCNGNVEDPARAGANFWVPISSLNDNAYNLVTIEDAVGNTAQFVIRKGTPSDSGETETADPDVPTQAQTETTAPDVPTQAPTESTTESTWKVIEGDAPNQWFYNNVTKQNISNVVNVQKAPWSEEKGVYITTPAGISEVNVNGKTEGVASIDGAGFIVYLSALTKQINEVTVTQGLGTSYIQIKNTEGSEDTPEDPTEATEAPTEETQAPTEVTEAPTEETQAPTEETEEPSEEPSVEPGHTWFSAANRWVHRQADGSFIAEDGAEYNGVAGISAAYSGDWGNAELEVANDESDLYTLPVNVIRSGNAGGWTMQVHLNYEGLDASKVYQVALKSDGNTLFTDEVSSSTTYRKTIDIGGKLAVGEHILTLEATEEEMPPEPVVENIVIAPRTASIEDNHNIWADWTNPVGTAKSYVYLEQVDNAHAAATLNNGWIFNDQAVQPMKGVDNVAQTRDASIKVEEGETYTLIVESLDAWGRRTGYGEVEITIPGLTPEEKEVQEYLAKINTTENLALNKTAIVAEGNNEADAKNIVDGNNGSRWQAKKVGEGEAAYFVDNTYFGVDLGALYSIDTVLVSWEGSNATDYEIYAAGNDGVYDDTPVATVSGLDNNKAVVKLSKNIDAEARYIKVVVTGWSDNARGYGISPFELAVFGGPEEGYYDVADYKGEGAETPYPTKTGKVFAGWFTDDTCTTPYTETTGSAYAKFIDEKVLTVKFQTKNDNTAVRFVSTIDDSDYNKVGFIFTGTYGDATITEKTKECNYVYSSLVAAGESKTASEAFNNDDSAYFFTYVVRGMDPDPDTSRTFNVKAFYETLDGTTVIGPANDYPQS